MFVVSAGVLLTGCTEISKGLTANQNRQLAAQLNTAQSRVHDPMVDEYFSGLGQMVIESARRIDRVDDPGFKRDTMLDIHDRFEVHVVHDVTPNAFTAGDDYAVINTALIALCESPEEMVMVLGHEFGHMRGGHVVQHFNRVQVALLAGVATEAAVKKSASGTREERRAEAESAAAQVIAACLPHTPDNEHESDATGLQVMADLGLDLQYADDFFERMLQRFGDGNGGSHPRPSVRIARIRSQVAALERQGYKPTRSLDRAKFLAARDRVRQLVKEGVESKAIVYWSAEQAKAQGEQQGFTKYMGCGPLYADPERAAQVLFEAVGLRR